MTAELATDAPAMSAPGNATPTDTTELATLNAPAVPAAPAAPAVPIVRRVSFDFADVPVHWVEGQPVLTHIANVFNILLPPGERWFCRSFRQALPQIEDDELRARLKAFVGQEAIHGRSHHAYLDKLEADGMPVLALMAGCEKRMTGPGDRAPLAAKVWMIAAVEVYTAMLGCYVFETDVFDRAHPVMRDLLLWHLAEEIEHKSVAFDVASAIDSRYRPRLVCGVIVSIMLLAQSSRLLFQLIRHDPDLTWRQAARDLWTERHQLRELARRSRRSFRTFLQRDYHPSHEVDPPNALAYFAQSPAVAAARG